MSHCLGEHRNQSHQDTLRPKTKAQQDQCIDEKSHVFAVTPIYTLPSALVLKSIADTTATHDNWT